MASPQDAISMANRHQFGAKLHDCALREICLRCVADLTFGSWQLSSEENPGQLGYCELLEELGLGGMGVVYKAHQPKLNRVVSLRMIQRSHAGAEAAAQLKHRHIDTIHDIGLREGYRWAGSH